MNKQITLDRQEEVIATQYKKEKEYWLARLAGDLVKTVFPYDARAAIHAGPGMKDQKDIMDELTFRVPPECFIMITRLSNESDFRMHVILTALLTVLLNKYTSETDIIVGAPVLKQDADMEFINTVLILKNRVDDRQTFKEFLLLVWQTVKGALDNVNYPMRTLLYQLKLQAVEDSFPLFDVGILLENIHEKSYLADIPLNMLFNFKKTDTHIECNVEYNSRLYGRTAVQRITTHFNRVTEQVCRDINLEIGAIDVLTGEEKERILAFNQTDAPYPAEKNVAQLFEEQVKKTPDNIVLIDTEERGKKLTYRELHEEITQVARHLRGLGVGPGTIIALELEISIDAVSAIMGILTVGGAYLPIDTRYPENRKKYILEDSRASLLLTGKRPKKPSNWNGRIVEIEDIGREPGKTDGPGAVNIQAGPSDLAYIIYTSGSTGAPKGVMVEHRGLVNYLWWAARKYVKSEAERFPLYSSLSFDLTVTSLFVPLISGNAIVIYRERENEFSINRIIEENNVSIIKLTPSHLELIREWPIDTRTSSIKCFIVGGEKFETSLARDIFNKWGGRIDIYNEYGPTEAVVGCMIHRFEPGKDWGDSVPIGKPINNARIHILDKYSRQVPPGVPGEIIIGGDGIARGYLNKPALTAEKFDQDLWDEKDYQDKKKNEDYQKFFRGSRGAILQKSPPCCHRFYKTGDLARWLPDPDEQGVFIIEFLGRLDSQVKIRGFRIELGEIENRLSAHPGIKEAVVLTLEESLCAYFVSSREHVISELREFLAKELPDYMVPSDFVQIEKMPLTPNGKIDREGLPVTGGNRLREFVGYVPPSNVVERKLVEVWENVLGKNNISINENFFMLGGDSIKSIQVMSRMSSAGYKLEMKDLFQYPVISDLAPRIKKLKRIPDQSTVSGVIPLTPIQEHFFDQAYTAPHYFNQAVLFYSRERLSLGAIKEVFSKILEHHDALRMTFRSNPENRGIVQVNHDADYPLSLEEYDLKKRENCRAELLLKVNEIQAGIDLENGPLMKLGLFHLDDGDRLLVAIHHLIIDGVSWRILFEDIEILYSQYKEDEPLALPLKTDSFKLWSEKLREFAQSGTFLKEKDHWSQLESNIVPGISSDFEVTENKVEDTRVLSFNLEKEETALLLTRVNQAYRTEVNDILLTALGLGIKKTFGQKRVLLALEGHGREEIFGEININRTVGWFTSVYPVVMDISYADDPGRQIKEIKETLRRIPNKGIGYGILKYLTSDKHKNEIEFKLAPQISFNYLGQFDEDIKQLSALEIAKESTGNLQSLNNRREYLLDINGIIAKNQLVVTIAFNTTHFKTETIGTLLNNFQSELCRVIAFCSLKEKSEFTPSDFTYKEFSIEKIDRFMEEYPGIEDIYTLTPMQEGMLFHTLMDEKSYSYFEQTSYRLQGELDIALVEKSLDELFNRHDILRTAFVYKNIERPVQIVLKGRTGTFYYEDINEIGKREEKENYIREFKAKDKARLFDMSKGELMRVSIFKVEDTEYEFIWSFHHILMDGWCIGILNSEFLEIYSSYVEKRPYQLPVLKPYRTYIQWLEKQDKEESARYWRNYLEFYEEQAGIPVTCIVKRQGNESVYKNEKVTIILNREKTAILERLAATNHVTLNIVTQVIWGILLGRYNGKEDMVFGLVVSGRPFDLEGVESILGLFINTVPVRIRFEGNMKFHALLQKIQEEAVAGESHHYNSLADIQAESTLKQNLINHLFMFENYPIADQIEGYGRDNNNKISFKLTNIDVFEQTNYDFNITLIGSERLTIFFEFNGNVFEKNFVERIAKHFSLVVDQVVENREWKIRELRLLPVEEMNRLLYEFNNTEVDFPGDMAIYQLIEEQVERAPDNIAVVGTSICSNHKSLLYITYKELNEKSDRFAHALNIKGVDADVIVGIMIERSIEIIIGILGTFKAGGAYLPIRPDYPEERIGYMLKDSSAQLLIATDIKEDEPVRRLVCERYTIDELLCLSYSLTSSPLFPHNRSNLAYIIYTSGSTGKPKGAMVEHIGMINHISAKVDDLRVSGSSIIAQNASQTFDISVWQFLTALTRGGRTVIYPDQLVLNPDGFISRLISDRITILEVVPSYLSVILNTITGKNIAFPHLEYLLVTGEEVKPLLVKQWFGLYPGIKMVNAYGPTEASDDITHHIMAQAPEGDRIPIGKPLQNMAIYIVDNYMQLCPIGVKGEIWVSGIGVGRGYLNDALKTGRAFTVDPFKKGEWVKLYKTGDLGRWLPDPAAWGAFIIEFMGRIDHQVKIHGFRIELGEIENRLSTHLGIKEAVVLDWTEENKETYLCAYIVSDRVYGKSELQEYLMKDLPDYMIPSYFLQVEKIPLTPNGKIDRKALPKPALEKVAAHTAPRNEIEKKLAALWAEVLVQTSIGIDDNFFDLGGHSLKATLLISKIHKDLNTIVPLAELFKTPTIRSIAEFIRGSVKESYEAITPAEKKDYYPVSPAQKRMYIEQQMQINTKSYNMPTVVILEGEVDRERMNRAFRRLLVRHESLRTSFEIKEEEVVQMIVEDVKFMVEYYESSEENTKEIITNFLRAFDLSTAPLLRAGLIKVGENRYILMVDMHHIISDGVSRNVLEQEFFKLYRGENLPPLQLHYRDFSEWQNRLIASGKMGRKREFWLSKFKKGDIPVLNLPVDFPRPPVRSIDAGCNVYFSLEPAQCEGIYGIIDKSGVSLSMVLLAAYYILLYNYSRREDIIIGVVASGRTHADLENIIGVFVNTIPLRNHPQKGKTFAQFLEEVKESSVGAFEHQNYPLDQLIIDLDLHGEAGRNTLFDVTFALDNIETGTTECSDFEVKPYQNENQFAIFDLALFAEEMNRRINLNFRYSRRLFKHSTVEMLKKYYIEIIEQIVDNTGIKLGEISFSHDYLMSEVQVEDESGFFL